MSFSHKIHFTAPVRMIFLAGEKAPLYFTEEEMESATLAAYQKGIDEATAHYQQQTGDRLNELIQMEQGVFSGLQNQHDSLVDQLRQVIPDLVMETVHRIFSEFKIDRETVATLVNEILREIPPGRQALEVVLCPHDFELIHEIESDFKEQYPAIEFRSDTTLQSGDCIVRTRFGMIDGRIATKLKTVESFLR